MTKFMLLQNYGATLACDVPMTEWDPADIKAHIDFQHGAATRSSPAAASWSTRRAWPGRSWPRS